MKMQINLLPESRKALAARNKRFSKIVNQEILFSIPVLVFIGMLAGIFLISGYERQTAEINFSSSAKNENYKDLEFIENKTKYINTKSSEIIKFQESHLKWADVLGQLVEVLPEGMSITSLSTKDYQIMVLGKADKRETLIGFQKRIEESSCFENINLPASNFVEKENINFAVDFYVKKDCLMSK